jgi:hypothetical protein
MEGKTMNHNQFKEWLLLSLYAELSPDDRRELKLHLEVCAECRAELGELKALKQIIGKRKLVEPTEQLLREARRELRVALRVERERRSAFRILDEFLVNIFSPKYRLVSGAAGLVGVGIFAGYLLFSPSPLAVRPGVGLDDGAARYSELGDAQITNVRFVDPDASDGQVEFMFEAVKPIRMKGSINDKQIQRVLAHALLNEANPGVRLRTVTALASQIALSQLPSGPHVQDEELVDALIEALRYDPNDGVRKEALKVLRTFPMSKRIRDALLFVLMHDNNPGLRVEAIKGMEQAAKRGGDFAVDEHLLNVLRQKIDHDDNNFIRLRAMALLQEVQQQ